MRELISLAEAPTASDAVVWEEVVCNGCGSPVAEILFSGLGDWLCGLPGEFRLMRCRNCGLVYLNPRPDERSIGSYYPEGYIPHAPAAARGRVAGRLRKAARALADLPYRVRFGSPDWHPAPWGTRRALDVGCGAGATLLELQRRGWEVYGVEPNLHAAEQARSRLLSKNIFSGTLTTVALPQDMFDLVVMWHSLEHVHDPRRTLERAAELLRAGGRLKIAIPNADSWEARVFQRFWRGYEPPRHLSMFSRATLEPMLRAAGLRIVRVRPHFLPVSISDSVDQWIESRFHIHWRRPRQRLTYALCYWPAVWSYVFGNDGCIEVDACKR